MTKRRRFTSSFKKKVVLAVLRGGRTIQDLAAHYEVHPNMVSTWKRQAIGVIPYLRQTLPGTRKSRCPVAADIAQAMKSAFYPDEMAWKEKIWQRGREITLKAIAGLMAFDQKTIRSR